MNPLKTCQLSTLSLLIVVTFSLGACAPVFAPPMRSTHYGAPGKLDAGQVEVGGGATFFASGGPQLAYALSDSFQLELGSDMRFVEEQWILGYGGIRYTPVKQKEGKVRWAFDLELGGGGGVGGVLACPEDGSNCQQDGRDWRDRTAVGGYLGLGLGMHVDWFSTFMRARGQVTDTTGVPTTLWLSATLGVGVDLATWFHLYVACGVAGYTNAENDAFGPLPEAGLSLTF